jgi:hypothetical protein
MTPAVPKPNQRPVRWTSRLLAALVIAASSVAIFGEARAVWLGQADQKTLALLVNLPGIAWLMNITFPAMLYARPAANAMWPFASSRVLGAYLVVQFLCLGLM